MQISEFFAAMLALLVLGLVWLILGGPGVLCAIAAMIVGNVDVSWIDDLLAEPKPLAEPTWHRLPLDAGAPTNVVPLKRKVS